MIHLGRVLIVDGDESFAEKATDPLEKEGFQCDRVHDIASAIPIIQQGQYDLAIIEIRNGDKGLETVGELLPGLPHLQVIATTDSPTLESAIQAIHLKLHAYLIKPVDLADLLQHVKSAIANRHLLLLNLNFKERIASAMNDLAAIKTTIPSVSPGYAPLSLEALSTYTLYNIAVSMLDLKQLVGIANHTASDKGICHLFECPRFKEFTGILREAVEVLEKTRTSFKSKELADLRKKLGQTIIDINHPK